MYRHWEVTLRSLIWGDIGWERIFPWQSWKAKPWVQLSGKGQCWGLKVPAELFHRYLSLLLTRSASARPENHREDYCPAGNCGKRTIWRSLAWEMVWGGCSCENLLLQRRAVLVSGGRDLPDSHAEARKHPGLHCCWQQGWAAGRARHHGAPAS